METREKIEKKVAIGTRDRSIYSNLAVTCEKEAVCPGRLDGSCSLYLNSTPQCSAVQQVERMDTRKLSVMEKNFARSLASSYTILFHTTKQGKVTTERNYHIRYLLSVLPLENANLNYTGQTLPPSFSMHWSRHAFQRYFQRKKGKRGDLSFLFDFSLSLRPLVMEVVKVESRKAFFNVPWNSIFFLVQLLQRVFQPETGGSRAFCDFYVVFALLQVKIV